MIGLILPALLLYIFSVFNILGIRRELTITQILFAVVAIAAFILVRKIGRPFFKRNAHLFYWVFVAVLIGTYIIGLEVKGSRRWIDLGFFNFQGSEFFKVFFILFLSEFLARTHRNINEFFLFSVSLLYFAVPAFIIFKQPDLANALVFFFIYFVMLLFSPLPKKYFVYSVGAIAAFMPLSWFFLKQYQKDRILSFVSPHIDQQGTSYNMMQAIITVGSGKFFGHGLGLGTQSRLFFLPENQTDFAFSSLVEQFGFIGGFVVIILFALLLWHITKQVLAFAHDKDEDQRSSFLFSIGLLSYLFFQIAINMGMNLGLLPVAGVAMPFISYGGSALVAIAIGLALLPRQSS